MRRKRAVDTTRLSLPDDGEERANVLATLINSPKTRSTLELLGVVNSTEQTARARVANAIMEDLSTAVSATKNRRNNDSTSAVRVGLSFACGERVQQNRLTGAVAKEININRKRITSSIQHRQLVLENKSCSWIVTERKTRRDAVSEDHRKLAQDFWSSPEISRPTGNKKDFIRQRVGPKEYIHHEKQIMNTTQTEAFVLFKQKHPLIKMGQRCFEKCKPFFVLPTRPQDRLSCCCRSHVEIRMLFAKCMEFRRRALARTTEKDGICTTFDHLTDAVNQTLCPKPLVLNIIGCHAL